MILTPATRRQKGHADTTRAVEERRGHSHCRGTLSKWKSFSDCFFFFFLPWSQSPPFCADLSKPPLRPGAKMSCRKRCKREIFKFAQYLFRLVTGTLNTGKASPVRCFPFDIFFCFADWANFSTWFTFFFLAIQLNTKLTFDTQGCVRTLAYHQSPKVFRLCVH